MSIERTQSAALPIPAANDTLLHRLRTRAAATLRTYRERQALSGLNDRELRDFGANRLDAQAESRRPFWDLPPMA